MKQISTSKLIAAGKLFPFLIFVFSVCRVSAASPGISYDVTRSTGVSYTSIATTGDTVTYWRNGVNTDDNFADSIPIGFAFAYNGTTYSKVGISTNGFLTFNIGTPAMGGGSGAYSPSNSSLSVVSGSTLTVAPFYDDLVCQGNSFTPTDLSSSIRYKTTGTAPSRVFTIEWNGMQTYQNTGPYLNFQAKLYETSGNIEFVYIRMEGFNGTSNYFHSYSSGLTAGTLSLTPGSKELLNQKYANTRAFDSVPSFSLLTVPDCQTKILFTPGIYTPYVAQTVPVANNDTAGSVRLSVGSSPCTLLCGTYYSSAGATPTNGVPSCTGNADDDVWFSFIASSTSTTITVRGSGGYNPAVQVFNRTFATVACQDSTGQGLTETVKVTNTIIGQNYYVRVYDSGTASGTTGQFSICVSATITPPSNDDCIGAVNLPVNPIMIMVTGTNTAGATPSANVATCDNTTPNQDVWYKFTALSQYATIQVQSNPGFDAAVQLLSGPCGNLTSLLCANSSSTGGIETISASGLTINSVYYVRVYNATGGAGSGDYTIGVSSATPACPTTYSPANGTAHVNSNGITLSWDATNTSTAYDVYLGTTTPPPFFATTASTSIFTGVLTQGATYYWRIAPKNGVGTTAGCFINAFAPPQPDVPMNIKVFIQGYYIGGGMMRAVLDTVNHPDITDSITVSLASITAPYPILFTTRAALKTNGLAHCMFKNEALLGTYYIVINHRNSIETWSYIPLGWTTSDTTYNFTTPTSSGFRLSSHNSSQSQGIQNTHLDMNPADAEDPHNNQPVRNTGDGDFPNPANYLDFLEE